MKMLRKFLAVALILALSATVVFAEGQKEGNGTTTEDKGSVELVYVEWARAVAITHVAGEMLTRMGYDVQLTSVANAAMWQALASGAADAHMTAWLPSTHSMFYGPEGEFTDEVEDLGVIYEGAGLGLVVPQYVEEESIEDLVANKEKYKGEIIGIDPGAGMMQQLEKAIDNNQLGLGALKLLEGSGPTMTAALANAVENQEPIVVTGWRPHWKFSRWDLKILDQSSDIFGESENIHVMARMGLKDEKPEVYNFLKNTDWAAISYGPVMADVADGSDPDEASVKFVDENLEALNGILPSGMRL
jgi:glycine betaine/proline transport system substrate-binding protein